MFKAVGLQSTAVAAPLCRINPPGTGDFPGCKTATFPGRSEWYSNDRLMTSRLEHHNPSVFPSHLLRLHGCSKILDPNREFPVKSAKAANKSTMQCI
eukprot:g8067.t1